MIGAELPSAKVTLSTLPNLELSWPLIVTLEIEAMALEKKLVR